ncbi:hypothetical protein AUEXF2481DRAFT_609404 [Aureobasidium subglaciale EXF-2481]|uniref:C3H1-type domain-containing protein n=1 Tax=Aureobasidium subglaciale (strain EXF-2481) TaxID=1043005 RepID=A0A074YFX7_AURSE|nr:uncharacterized protein AUEXF2481DRAFT_609404 [Aureobasidium subglaciale EXF-2481]KEQ96718.1 hypothetical protein AUEXF2481DRAFT_609404 [Aureobasidium subglaciale EXF-2481]
MDARGFPFRRHSSLSASPERDAPGALPTGTRASYAETSSSPIGSQSVGPTKPKNFRVPLTCFFWFHAQHCQKSDGKCM